MVEAICECTEGVVVLDKYYKLSKGGEFQCYRGACPGGCGKFIESYEEVPRDRSSVFNPRMPKRKHRDRPQYIPMDLADKLEEEKRLRKQREQDVEEAEEESVDSQTAEKGAP